MIFVSGTVYTSLQSCLSHRLRKVHPHHVSGCVLSLRIIFCSLLALFAISGEYAIIIIIHTNTA